MVKERLSVSNPATSLELISRPPVFDIEGARVARNHAFNFVEGRLGTAFYDFEPDSLQLAVALAYYNFNHQRSEKTPREKQILENQLSRLVRMEWTASDSESPLPTIGIEVETPRKPFKKQEVSRYKEFFDAIGMPRNRANVFPDEKTSYWEFSPEPSYSAEVQARILNELIKGGFIVSLRFSQEPRDIREHLDDKLVSLHLNLGIPPFLAINSKQKRELRIFSTVLGVAFSSPERLRERQLSPFYRVKGAAVFRHKAPSKEKLEITALEVRTQNTYRLLKTAQILATSMFTWCLDPHLPLSSHWEMVKADFQGDYGLLKGRHLGKKKAADLAAQTNVGTALRHILNRQRILQEKSNLGQEMLK